MSVEQGRRFERVERALAEHAHGRVLTQVRLTEVGADEGMQLEFEGGVTVIIESRKSHGGRLGCVWRLMGRKLLCEER